MTQDRPQLLWNASRNTYAIYQMVLTLSDLLECLCEIFNDTNHRAGAAACLR